jgi:MarR family transcriptional regulator, organic hydroperoxide resistance regulator
VESPERGDHVSGAPTSEVATRAWRLLRDLLEAQQARWRRGLAEKGLTTVQAHALMEMAEMPPGPMTRLADRLGVDPSWVTGLVDRLQARGEVARRPSPEDRRVKIVELTGAGQRTCQALRRLTDEPPRELLELPEADLRELLRITGDVLQLRRRHRTPPPGPAPRGGR